MITEADDHSLACLELQRLSSLKAIAGVSLPAVVLNAAPPITIAVQTALLGRYAHTSSLAAFATVGTCVGFVRSVFNFLVDGVSTKVGRCVGQRAWAKLASHVRLSILWSLLLGAAAVPLLLAARSALCSWLLAEDARQEAAGYWLLRSCLVPAQLVAMAAAGVLQGFGRVRVNAVLTSTAAALELVGSAAVVRYSSGGSDSLLALGCVTCICQGLLAAAALACIVALPPPEARDRIDLLRQVFGFTGGRCMDSSDAGQPFLAGVADERQSGQGAASSEPAGAACEGEAAPPASTSSPSARLLDAATLEFLRDGLDMFVRSVVLQLTFLIALAAASRLGTAALAAHSIIGQLWVVVSYAVDGFAVAGIVLGSRLLGLARDPQLCAEAKSNMTRLTRRILLAGGLCGAAAGLTFWLASSATIAAFTSDPAVAAALRRGGAWAVLAAAQPLNGLLFVFDGLLMASQNFRFIRNYMAAGFTLVFLPALLLGTWLAPGLASIWSAKAALNVWRLAGAAHLVFCRFLPSFGQAARQAQTSTEEAAPLSYDGQAEAEP